MDPSSNSSSSVVKLGPWGSTDRTSGRAWDDGGFFTGIRNITIQHSTLGVETIRVEYDLLGQPVLGQMHGVGAQQEELNTSQIDPSFPDEFLTGISGYHNGNVFQSLMFTSNTGRNIGPFGVTSSRRSSSFTPFGCSVDGRKGAIVGFSGRSGWYLNAMEIYVAVLCPPDEFFDAMEQQGLVAYRTSPLVSNYTLRG